MFRFVVATVAIGCATGLVTDPFESPKQESFIPTASSGGFSKTSTLTVLQDELNSLRTDTRDMLAKLAMAIQANLKSITAETESLKTKMREFMAANLKSKVSANPVASTKNKRHKKTKNNRLTIPGNKTGKGDSVTV